MTWILPLEVISKLVIVWNFPVIVLTHFKLLTSNWNGDWLLLFPKKKLKTSVTKGILKFSFLPWVLGSFCQILIIPSRLPVTKDWLSELMATFWIQSECSSIVFNNCFWVKSHNLIVLSVLPLTKNLLSELIAKEEIHPVWPLKVWTSSFFSKFHSLMVLSALPLIKVWLSGVILTTLTQLVWPVKVCKLIVVFKLHNLTVLSILLLTKYWPLELIATDKTQWEWALIVLINFPVSKFQILMVFQPPPTIILCSELIATQEIVSWGIILGDRKLTFSVK